MGQQCSQSRFSLEILCLIEERSTWLDLDLCAHLIRNSQIQHRSYRYSDDAWNTLGLNSWVDSSVRTGFLRTKLWGEMFLWKRSTPGLSSYHWKLYLSPRIHRRSLWYSWVSHFLVLLALWDVNYSDWSIRIINISIIHNFSVLIHYSHLLSHETQ